MLRKRQKENLNLFGEWLETLAAILKVHWADIARRSGIKEATISCNARSPDNQPWPKTVRAMWSTIQEMAQERGIVFPPSVEQGFTNAANRATETQKDVSGTILRIIRDQYDMAGLANLRSGDISTIILEAYQRNVDEIHAELKRKEERIAELEAELREHS